MKDRCSEIDFASGFDELQKIKYMRRALLLAANGRLYTSPNPMVGAVIVAPDGRIIGEGWHRRCGSAHAEVNAVASVSEADQCLLPKSTMFVTLEPCSHYGKTPPCARLIIERQIPNVVVAMVDPNPKVGGRGIEMLRQAGIGVEVGVCEKEATELNKKFITSMLERRPYITLKWARSADGYMDRRRSDANPGAFRFSTLLTEITTMKLRAANDAVLTTSATVRADNPRLTLRRIAGRQPQPVILTGRGGVPSDSAIMNGSTGVEPLIMPLDGETSMRQLFQQLFSEYGISSVLVEAGPRLLRRLIDEGLWDEAREEISPDILGSEGTAEAPTIDSKFIRRESTVGRADGSCNVIRWYSRQ